MLLTFCEPPEAVFDPDQAPEAVQLVTLAVVQVRVEEPPDATVLGEAVRVKEGRFSSSGTICGVHWNELSEDALASPSFIECTHHS